MADIRLAKPAAGATQSVPCEPDARFVFDFPTTDATLAREGDNLNIRFEDGASLQLQGFYEQYNEENLPSFNIDGTEVAAADFFQAMNEPDLMPAAGPGTGTAANGARFHEWGDSSLASGLTHLNGLDLGFSRGFEWDDVPNAVGFRSGQEGSLLYTTTGGEPEPPSIVPGTTTVTITTDDVRESDDGTVTFDIQLSKAPLRGHSATVQVRVGDKIHDVAVDARGHGVLEVAHGNAEDVYKDASAVTATVVGVTGGRYEKVETGQSATAKVEDTIDTTTVEITPIHTTEGDNGTVSFDILLSNPPQGITTVQVQVGDTVYDVEVDESGHGTLTVEHGNAEDVYKDGSDVTATVVGVTGGNYEDVETGQSATANVKDTIDTTTVEITPIHTTEGGDGKVSFDIQLSNPPQGITTVQVQVGDTIYDVDVDATGYGTLTVEHGNAEDVYKDGSEVTATVVGVTGGNYEEVKTGQSATANVKDTIDTTTVEITPIHTTEGGDGKVSFDIQLSHGPDPKYEGETTVQVKIGETVHNVKVDANGHGTLTVEHGNAEDVYEDGSTVTATVVDVTGGNYEKVVTGQSATAKVEDTIDTTTVKITPKDVQESDNGTVSFDIQLSNPPQGITTVQVQVGDTIYDVEVDANGYGTLTVEHGNAEDVYKDASTVTATVVGVTGGNYERVDTTGASATAKVEDTINDTRLTLSVNADSVVEGSSITVTATLTHPSLDAMTITLESGQTIEIESGALMGSVEIATRSADNIAQGTETLTFKIKDVTGGDQFEKLVTGDPVTVKVTETFESSFTTKDANFYANGADAYSVDIPEGYTLTPEAVDAVNNTIDYGKFSIEDGKLVFTQSAVYSHAGGENNESEHNFDSVTFEVTDAQGTPTTWTATVSIEDDGPTAWLTKPDGERISTSASQSSISFVGWVSGDEVMTAAGKFEELFPESVVENTKQNGTTWVTVNGVRFIASDVQYAYDEGTYNVDEVNDENGKAFGDNHGNKTLSLTAEGLGVGNVWGEGTNNSELGMESGYNRSEAMVIESRTNDAHYGVNLEFGCFGQGDRALVTFMMTTTANNDDVQVYQKVVSYEELVDRKIEILVPDGFTKMFISAVPGENDGQTVSSSFTLRGLEFTRPAWEHSGQLAWDAGADGLKEVSFLMPDGQFSKGVDIKGALGSGHYGVHVSDVTPLPEDPATLVFSATLTGPDDYKGSGNTSLVGKTLFKGTFNTETGEWKLYQFYNFDITGKENAEFNLNFSVTDGDDDTVTIPQLINADLDITLERFQNVVIGTPAKNTNASDDIYADILHGENANDLMYGNGGNDILFGDADPAGQNQLGYLTGQLKLQADASSDDIYAALKTLAGTEAGQEELKAILSGLEGIQKEGGDDALLGGLGNDILFGGAGDDFLYGNGKNKTNNIFTDQDILVGGAGNDIIVYDDATGNSFNCTYDGETGDVIVHGGSGIDILLVGNKVTQSLAELQSNANAQGTYVRGFEVLIRATDTSNVENKGITSHQSLAQYGVDIDEENNTLHLTGAWQYANGKYVNAKAGLELETTLNNVWVVDTGTATKKTGQNGNDVLLDAEAAAVIGVALQDSSFADVLQNHEELASKLGNAVQEGSYSNVFGGGGDDILFNKAANSVLLGDGNDATKDGIDTVLHRGGALIKDYIAENQENADKLSGIAADLEKNEKSEGTLESAEDGSDIIHGGAGSEILYGGGKADHLDGGAGDDILIGGSGDDTLLGGDGNDLLFGGSGDDYLHGGDGTDTIFGGSGNDLIVYDKDDYLIDGGADIDVLLAGLDDPTLKELTDSNKVNDVEVLIKGVDTLDITSMEDLASKLGIHIEGNSMTLDKGWQLKDGTGVDGKNAEFEKDGVTLETSLDIEPSTTSTEAEQAAFTLSNSQG